VQAALYPALPALTVLKKVREHTAHMALLRFHLPVALVLAAAAYGAALAAVDADGVPPPAVCAASLSLRLLPHAALLEELRRCAASLPSFTEQ
jgi:hypothetical protein